MQNRKSQAQRLLDALITFFETGIAETDAAAKAILQADADYHEYWQVEIEHFQKSVEWTGIRSPEAELLAAGLEDIRRYLEDKR